MKPNPRSSRRDPAGVWARFAPSRLGRRAAWLCVALLGALPVHAADSHLEGGGAEVGDWPAVSAPLAARSLLLDVARAGDRLVAVGERGHILVSDDDGASWRQRPSPTSVMLTAVSFGDADTGFAVGHDAVILRTRDRGETWELQYRDSELESPLLDVLFESATRGFAVGAYGLFLETSDGGEHWQQRSISERDSHLNALFKGTDGTLYIVGEFGTLLASNDDGGSWSAIETPYAASYFGGLGLPAGDLLIFGLRGTAYRRESASGRFVKLDTGTLSSLMTAILIPPDRLLIGGADGAFLEGSPTAEKFTATRRADRGTVTSMLADGEGRAVLVGAFGSDHWEESR